MNEAMIMMKHRFHSLAAPPAAPPAVRPAMTLIELLVTLVVVVLLGITIAPALGHLRGESKNDMSRANLMQLGQGRDQYALDNQDRIFTYTWEPGVSYQMPNGQTRVASSYQEAASDQNTEILMRRTGRITGITKISTMGSRLNHRRFSHLVLLDYIAGDNDEVFSGPLAIDPADQNRLVWNERPLQYSHGSGVPYVNGIPSGYDSNFSWSSIEVRQRWAFSSSYEVVPYSWQGDGPNNVYIPVSSTPHLFQASGSPDLSGRFMSQVAFPSRKVHMHEDHDREVKRHLWFAYGTTRVEKLMFDGSLNARLSSESRPAESPAQPGQVWRQAYVPIEHFPIPRQGFFDNRELDMRFRWTKDGLQGFDY